MTLRDIPRSIAAALTTLAFAALLAMPPNATGQPAGADGDYFLYHAEAGDSLIRLSNRYTQNESNWRRLQSENGINDPTTLPVAKEVRIPFSLIPESPAEARASHVVGDVTVNGTALQPGTTVKENDIIQTGKHGFVTFIMNDGSNVSLPPQSTLHIERLRAFQGTGLSDAILTIREGGLESAVAPNGPGVGRFEVRTPVSVTGVRGTQLRVRTHERGSQSEVISGAAMVDALRDDRAVLARGQGAATGADGKLLSVRTLLPAPEVSPLERGEGGWTARITPVEGAVRYLMRITLDEAGTQVVHSEITNTPSLQFNVSHPGQLYMWVRAIDENGIMGRDTQQAFVNISALRTAFSDVVRTSFGSAVFLRDF